MKTKKFKSIFIKGLLLMMVLMIIAVGCAQKSSNETSTSNEAPTNEAANETTETASTIDFPTKDLTIIVPYDAGGGVDITSRLFAEVANSDELMNGHKIIVENRGGGGAVVGHTYVANAKSDGYTILAYTNAIISNPLLKETTYQSDDFKVLSMVCFDPDVIVTPLNSQFNTLEDLVEYAKTNTVLVSTPGHSSIHHSAAVVFAEENGLNFEYLHSDSAAVQMQQVMGGHCDVAFVSAGESIAQIQDGTIRGIATMSSERLEGIEELPTLKEEGYDITYGAFRGFAVKSDVPDAEYEALKAIFEKVGSSDELKEKLENANIPYEYNSAADFSSYVENYTASFNEILPILQNQ